MAIGFACGIAIVGLKLGTPKLSDLEGVEIVIRAFAFTGALFGTAVGAKLFGGTSWMMLIGSFLGGIAAIFLNGNGKALIYGAPLGAVVALVLGLVRENRMEAKLAASRK